MSMSTFDQSMPDSSRRNLRPTLRTHSNVPEAKEVYILVMGLTGAGKSTFVSVMTDDDDVPIGKDGELDCVTQNVQDYAFTTKYQNVDYTVRLIDSPGFDDGVANDAEILLRIATYINTLYKLNVTLAGVLYLHDITKARVGGVGLRNLRMLEKMVGMDRWDNCTLVTTKWGCTNNPDAEEERETQLKTNSKFLGSMVESAHSASMKRFYANKASGLEIIRSHLHRKFTPKISEQMVNPKGPKLSLGETDAGKEVADNLEKLAKVTEMAKELAVAKELAAAKKVLQAKFDEKLFEEFKQKRDALLFKHRSQRAARWLVRSTILGGGVAATVITMGPGASSFALVPVFETYAKRQRRSEQAERQVLAEEYKKESSISGEMSKYDPKWLWSGKVKSRKDLDNDDYSLNNDSQTSLDSLDILKTAEKTNTRR